MVITFRRPLDRLLRNATVPERPKQLGIGPVDAGDEPSICESDADLPAFDRAAFISALGHELRTPLHAILGFADLIGADAPSLGRRQAQALAELRKAALGLAGVVDRTLTLAEDEAEPAVVRERIDPRLIVRDALDAVRREADARGVTLHTPPAIPGLAVMADPARLRQVLLHLLTNAVRHNRPGGSVLVEIRQTPGSAVIAVHDTGPGLPPGQLADLFAPRAGSRRGLGVGLTISRRLARAMDAELTATSRPGEGCSFSLTLPAASDAVVASTSGVGPALAPVLAQAVVLYIDDHPANGLLMRHVMAALGPRLHVAETGAHGLRMARELKPDVILLDIHLPDIDGFRVKAELAADPATRDLPVVALTAGAAPDDARRALRAGFAAWLTKPLEIARLTDTLQRVLGSPLGAAKG